MIKAIETIYKGYRFRSRLEARWAVFFDALGITWRYEHQGYEIDGRRYLPDFEIVDAQGDVWFVEVKGDPTALVDDYRRYVDLLDWGGCLPGFADCADTQKTGLILLGEIPDASERVVHFHPIIQHHEGLCRSWASISTQGVYVHTNLGSKSDQLSYLCGLATDIGLEADSTHWLVETRIVRGKYYDIRAQAAYLAARQARFEHGQIGAMA